MSQWNRKIFIQAGIHSDLGRLRNRGWGTWRSLLSKLRRGGVCANLPAVSGAGLPIVVMEFS